MCFRFIQRFSPVKINKNNCDTESKNKNKNK